MSATVRDRGGARMAAFAFGAAILGTLALPMGSARAQLTLVDFGVTSLPPSLTLVRMSASYARSVLVWPGAARLPVVMP
jgi:hypothetical protein